MPFVLTKIDSFRSDQAKHPLGLPSGAIATDCFSFSQKFYGFLVFSSFFSSIFYGFIINTSLFSSTIYGFCHQFFIRYFDFFYEFLINSLLVSSIFY